MKIFKHNNKLVIHLPFDVIKDLKLDENEEVEFFRYNNKAFLFAKKSEITSLLLGSNQEPVVQKRAVQAKEQPRYHLTNEEVAVLKKLDTIRYPSRTKESVSKILDHDEKAILQQLLKKKVVNLFRGSNNTELYSISKSIYDNFLLRKKPDRAAIQEMGGVPPDPNQELVDELEERGFLVVQTEAEAAKVSLSLEDSIRHGKVLGTRAFNKKFYIVTRQFFETQNPRIIKAMRDGTSKTDEIADSAGVSEDAARAILYLLAESGDARERRKDYFVLA